MKLHPTTKFILLSFTVWRLTLEVVRIVGSVLLPAREGFLGPIPWANFDGMHYLSIAQSGYFQYEQAFFPVYPLLIRWIGNMFGGNYLMAGMLISNLSLLGSLGILAKLIDRTDTIPSKQKHSVIRWSILFLLVFPTSFYFGGVYSESLFLLLVLSSFYALSYKHHVWYGILASFASATRLVGAFLLVPLGLFGYMYHLGKTYGDPLFFIHAQPAFGANRSGGDIIFLPQVLWRYVKIFTTVSLSSYDYWIALLELTTLFGALYLLYIGWKRKLPFFWIVFSTAAIVGPTMTGSLSSVPRYVLAAFPIFIVLAMLGKKARIIVYAAFCLLLSVLTLLFARGYWVS